MMLNLFSKSIKEELPSEFADRLGILYNLQTNLKHKKDNGQFFTPIEIANLMASFCNYSNSIIKILDPGCGTAILSCALIEYLVSSDTKIKTIELKVYEIDTNLIPITQKTLKYLSGWLTKKNIQFQYEILDKDFVVDNAKALNDHYNGDVYDIIISNPPYFKLSKDDEKTIAAKKLISGQPNIYSIFMGISAKLLSNKGELIFITPRSFASGNYFKTFRESFFNTIQLHKIHLFNSRKETFNRDKVLQETVIIKGIKGNINANKDVYVSSSKGLSDIQTSNFKYFKLSDLIDLNSKEKILHLPTSNKEEKILKLVSTWKNVLSDFNINISTGPVVSFRALEFIQNNYENGTVFLAPLFWLHHVDKMQLNWPKHFKGKGQFIRIVNESRALLIPNKNYIFLRRFSTKDDNSRLIAAPYFCSYNKSDCIGVENKVNYIYRKNGHLHRNEVVGLCALLNSEFFDTYFQSFNGNVNVSATELREMKFPSLQKIKEIGDTIILSNNYSMEWINRMVNETIEMELVKNSLC